MRIVMFYHSLLSDWRNSDAHFLRGAARELVERGHDVELYEPDGNPYLANLSKQYGQNPIARLKHSYPSLKFNTYNLTTLEIDKITEKADLVIVGDYNHCELIEKFPAKNFRNYNLVLHLLHSKTCRNMENYDGALVSSNTIVENAESFKTIGAWNNAVDTRLFYPKPSVAEADVIWTGDWFGEEESYINEYIIKPVFNLKLKATIIGTGFPETVIEDFKAKGINYIEWLPNWEMPAVLAKHKLAINFALSPGAGSTLSLQQLMACGIPVVSVLKEYEELFVAGRDYLFARSGTEMQAMMQDLILDKEKATELAVNASRAVNRRHTCFHRANELETLCEKLGIEKNKIYPGNAYRTAV